MQQNLITVAIFAFVAGLCAAGLEWPYGLFASIPCAAVTGLIIGLES